MGFLKRLGLDEDRLRAQEIRSWAAKVPGVDQIAVCRPRSRARVVGIVQSIKVIPQEDTTRLEVQIFDGTDEITGVWFGRRRIPGIDLGKGLVMEGTIGNSRKRILEILNPEYQLLPASDLEH
ncbi:MAG: OB-fold nucleic acid binding domain-containing protein [Actinomycetota bacterium]